MQEDRNDEWGLFHGLLDSPASTCLELGIHDPLTKGDF